jgi:type II secretory ATPase GspE/PulE/Tfp pilus assembly ATPase PilB-like protein
MPDLEGALFSHSDKGCEACHHRGHQGRSLIGETLTLSKPLIEALTKNIDVNDLYKVAIEHGTETLSLHAVEMLLHGSVSLEEVRRVTSDLFS